jgi:glycosyltransferase involved in cell wall biosynthesis
VTILGAVDQPTLHDLMARARVAVSVPESDATSAALLEALATGLRVVVNDLPANREWVDPAIGIITSRDPSRDELARAMIDATRLGPADPRQAVSSVTWSREIDRLREAIEAQTWRS